MNLDDIEKTLNIPEKLFFSIKEVSKILELNASVLRYWEKEFQIIQPKRNQFGHRQYRRNDVLVLGLVRELLYNRKFSIEGAKQEIKNITSGKKSVKKDEIPVTENHPVSQSVSQNWELQLNQIIRSVETLIKDIEVAIQ
ncbi:MAG: MerR family transcriptional regulator [bacterium]|nr:MerR family transcriptional regulator [bacterium]